MMQGANDFTPAWWEKRVARLTIPPIPSLGMISALPLSIFSMSAIFCRTCNEQTTPTRQGYECPTCGARVALCGNTRRGHGRCSNLAGHDGPCWGSP